MLTGLNQSEAETGGLKHDLRGLRIVMAIFKLYKPPFEQEILYKEVGND